MATWDEVRAHLRSRWRVEHDTPTELAISFKFVIGAGEMHQALVVTPTQVEGAPWLAILGDLFPESSLSPRGALVYADRMPFASIVLRDDRYLVRFGLALSGLGLDSLDWHLGIVAREAVQLRANLLGPSADKVARAFGNYSE